MSNATCCCALTMLLLALTHIPPLAASHMKLLNASNTTFCSPLSAASPHSPLPVLHCPARAFPAPGKIATPTNGRGARARGFLLFCLRLEHKPRALAPYCKSPMPPRNKEHVPRHCITSCLGHHNHSGIIHLALVMAARSHIDMSLSD